MRAGVLGLERDRPLERGKAALVRRVSGKRREPVLERGERPIRRDRARLRERVAGFGEIPGGAGFAAERERLPGSLAVLGALGAHRRGWRSSHERRQSREGYSQRNQRTQHAHVACLRNVPACGNLSLRPVRARDRAERDLVHNIGVTRDRPST